MEPYLGEIKLFPYDRIPAGWLLCDGRQLPLATNQALYSLLGITYGGDGRNNFNLPDLQGRVPVHTNYGVNPDKKDRITSQYGKPGGAESVVLNGTQLPPHTHQVYGENAASDSVSPIGGNTCLWAVPANPQTKQPIPVNPFSNVQTNVQMDPSIVGVTGGAAHDNMQPFLVLIFCIAVQGIYPIRP